MKTLQNTMLINAVLICFLVLSPIVTPVRAATDLADSPLFSAVVPGNVALSLSVEFPTALGSAYTANYNIDQEYVGYFDPNKCYAYFTNPLSGIFNTGVDDNKALLSDGSNDPHWVITSKPSGSADNNNVEPSYIGSTSTAKSIGAPGQPDGEYRYATTFNIPTGVDPTKVVVAFKLAYDDNLTDIRVNGISTGISNPSLSVEGIDVVLNSTNSTFQTGTNTIQIRVNNIGGEATIRVDQATIYEGDSYFSPVATVASHNCSTITNGRWSGNFLNWALTQTIDPFRYALSGGYRSTDKVGLTILEKAFASGQGGTVATPTINNNITVISQSTPFTNLTNLRIRIRGLGNKFYFTGSGDLNNPGGSGGLLSGQNITSTPDATRVYEMFARVQVCKSGLLEKNCTLYPNGDSKPTGLIQKNAMKLNFAAFGYLNDGSIQRDGGVLRASMGPVGPIKPVPGSSGVANTDRAEWDSNTGIFYTNPHSGDAGGAANSGVINYLNKFGLTAPGYKTFDPVGELYYSTLRYYRNKGNVDSYTNNATTAMQDGFPVITNWTDPIKYSCQANFVIGIGDTNTHADANLPGSTIRSGNEPALPAQVANDYIDLSVDANFGSSKTDVKTSTNRVGAMEGSGNLGEIYTPWCCNNNTFFMAGLAYDVHTRDFRPDLNGKQTITTFWLDVLESGDRARRNQFLLTAKYGGFTVPANYSPYTGTATPLTTAQWDTNGDLDPDNYFRANNPSLMIQGLNDTFDKISDLLDATTSGFILSTPNVQNDDLSFSASYNANNWTGNVIGKRITYAGGVYTETNIWEALSVLEAQAKDGGWNTSRFISTANCSAKDGDGKQTCVGVPFRFNDISAANKTALSNVGATPVSSQSLLNFLRGDRSNAGSSGTQSFRDREKILGDIVNSKIRAIGKPSAPYGEVSNPGYTSFKTTYASRPTVAYVGANDGMLHAFNGEDGRELFAFIPNALFLGPNNTPSDDGLAALAKVGFVHHPYVDASPVVNDVNFGGSTGDWHSLLVGGLGKGGKSYYAIDVSNPLSLSSEAAMSSAFKWEFTHKDLGYTYGKPVIVRAGSRWVVIVTSGYNNVDGKGYFFILDPEDGSLIAKVGTGAGSPTSDAGLAHAAAFSADGRTAIADAVYAGDLLGNLWRLDLTGADTGNFPAPVKIATLTSSTGVAQPVTIPPALGVDQNTGKRYVFVGTGKLLANSDVGSTQEQTFYAINDGTLGQFFTSATLPTNAGGFPIDRSKLVNNSSGIEGIDADINKPMGYFVDLGFTTNGVAYKINVDLATAVGVVGFAANSANGDQCSAELEFKRSAYSYGTGKSVLLNNNGDIVKEIKTLGSLATGIVITGDPEGGSGTNSITVSSTDGKTDGGGLSGAGAITFKQLNWRELPTTE